MNAKIEVYKSSTSSEIVAEFTTIEELLTWNETHDVYADQISVNECMLMGWDELYDFV